ncbi:MULTISPECIES: ABC transporter permease [Bacillaceae]|uniref:ABC transporter permease n=1 Tax=Bacillaceae TaxID=186817 RepID=UPI0007001655|nr:MULTISPECIES: ABC transporter permease [Bacillaceae]KQL35085.1 sodium ABC transporter permease [Psychrobacillus sp. FJAT-21963]MDF2067234.1 ABC transporter permease [Bacillus sp. Cr_A10]
MSKFWLLVKQLYTQKIKAKSFIISIIIYVGVISVFMFWSDIKEAFFQDEPLQVALLNETEADIEALFQSSNDIEFTFPTEEIEEVEKQVVDGDFDAAIFIKDQDQSLAAEIATFEPLTFNDQQSISAQLQYAGKLYEVQQLNLTAEQAEKILQSETVISMKSLDESATGKSEDEKAAGIGASMLVGFIIYSFVMSFLSMITTDVASEKGSRVLEVLLASVKPSTHFMAKLTGTFLLALTQIGALLLVQGLLFMVIDGGSKWDTVIEIVNELSYSFIGYAVLFLLLTILLFLIIGALLGSLVSKVEESSQAMMPAMMLGVIGFYVLLSGMYSPDTLIIKIFSYIPFTAGMVMPLRIGATDISSFEPMLSMLILIGTVILMFLLSLSFYKRSVLTYSSGGIIQKIKTVLKVTT